MPLYEAKPDDIVIDVTSRDDLFSGSYDGKAVFESRLLRLADQEIIDGQAKFYPIVEAEVNFEHIYLNWFRYIIVARDENDFRPGTLVYLREDHNVAYSGKYIILGSVIDNVTSRASSGQIKVQHLRSGWYCHLEDIYLEEFGKPATLETYQSDYNDAKVFIRRVSRRLSEAVADLSPCVNCDTETFRNHISYSSNGASESFCPTCAESEYFNCYICESDYTIATGGRRGLGSGRYACETCFETMVFTCYGCERMRIDSSGGDIFNDRPYCERCYEARIVESLVNPPSSVGYLSIGKLYSTKSNSFKINQSRTVASLEIELIGEGYEEIGGVPDGFYFERDGSLSSGGAEFIMRPTLGDDIGYKIESLCRWALDYGWAPDNSCGIHIHTNALDMGVPELKGMLLVMRKMENYIYKMIPPERKHLRFSKKMADVSAEDIEGVNNVVEISKLWYEKMGSVSPSNTKYNNSRYRGFNLHARFLLGTLEYRYHEGSVNYERIYNWTKFCLGLTDFGKTLMDKDKKLIEAFKDDLDRGLDWYLAVMGMSYLEKYLYLRMEEYKEAREKYAENREEIEVTSDSLPSWTEIGIEPN